MIIWSLAISILLRSRRNRKRKMRLTSFLENTTGLKSVYTEYSGSEIMFHVSTMLPSSGGSDDPERVSKHISIAINGNNR